MKRFMVETVIAMSLLSLPTQAFSCSSFLKPFNPSTLAPKASFNDVDVAVVLAGIAAGAGICYLVSCLPSCRLYSAQNTYHAFDQKLADFIEYVNKNVDADLEALTARLYPCSAYPLVKMFNALCSAQQDAKGAIKSLDTAMWWSHEESFVRTCTHFKKLLTARLKPLEHVMVKLREQRSWLQQYALYLQQYNNGRVTYCESSHCDHYIYQKEQKVPVNQTVVQPAMQAVAVTAYPAQLPSDFVVFDQKIGCWQINEAYIG